MVIFLFCFTSDSQKANITNSWGLACFEGVVEKMTSKRYSTSVYWSDEDEGYIAVVPEFPGLSAFGETKEEAIREAADATDGFIETYKEQGKKLP